MGDSGGTVIKTKSLTIKNNAFITCQLLQPYVAKYLVIVADRGMTSEGEEKGTVLIIGYCKT